jgi:hypothetical protein
MWQNFVGNFVLASITIIFIVAVAKWATARFTNVSDPRVAAFSLAIGYALAEFQFSVSVGSEGMSSDDTVALGQGAGAITTLWFVWWWLFRRSEEEDDALAK